jgi:hypothetical protein
VNPAGLVDEGEVCAGVVVAECGFEASGEHGCAPDAFAGEGSVADGVDAAVDLVKVP